MPHPRLALLALTVTLPTVALAHVDDPPRRVPIVAAFERFARDDTGRSELGGRILIGDLGCTSCHAPDLRARSVLTPKPAPRLRDVAGRLLHDDLLQRIADPHRHKPGTTMPDVWASTPDDERDESALDIVHFLTSLAPSDLALTETDEGAAARGRALFLSIGCVACHAPDGEAIAGSIPLPAQRAGRYDVDALASFLRDPLRTRPGGRMPSLSLSHRDALDIAHHLARGTQVDGALRYERFDVPLEGLPELAAENPAPTATGVCDAIDLSLARRRHDYALRFRGLLRGPTRGTYTLHVTADDGRQPARRRRAAHRDRRPGPAQRATQRGGVAVARRALAPVRAGVLPARRRGGAERRLDRPRGSSRTDPP